jgi:hypothetical protein
MPTVFASKGQGLCDITQYINAPCGYPDIGAVRVVDALDYPYQYDKFATSGTRYFQVETKVDCYIGITMGTLKCIMLILIMIYLLINKYKLYYF